MEDQERIGLTTLHGGLAISLERIQALREKMPPEERNVSQSVVVRPEAWSRAPEPPITREQLARILGPLETIYTSPNIGQDGTNLKYQVFYAVLGHLPEKAVARAVRAYVTKIDSPHEYFPKPAQLLALAK